MNYRKIALKKEENKNLSLLEKLLESKNLSKKEEIEKFLNPSREDFIPPSAFLDMEKAKKRIETAIEKKETILVWGDFDCDGVTSTTILYKALKFLEANVIEFIPDRLEHGHGLNSKELIKLISKEKVKVVITVDCGISNISEVSLLKGLGVDTIITDHHTTDIELPNAYAIINPQVKGSIKDDLDIKKIESLTYNSGSIVAYKVAMTLLENKDCDNLKDELLVIATCGAIADVVPLLGENRAIVFEGLKILNEKQRNSNKAIFSLLEKNVKDRKITSYDIGFILAPRINAIGRLSNAKLSFEFLMEENDQKLEIIISKLDNFNSIRQAKCQETYLEAKDYLKNHKEEENLNAIILMNENWHVGVIGIVAARLVEEYQKPCFLMTKDEKNNARCSIRSLETLNVYQALKENQDLFLGFGGHKLAGGCSFDLSKISFEEVKKSLIKTIDSISQKDENKDTLFADIEVDTKDINIELVNTINKFEPFGQNNEPPLCAMFGVFLDDFKTIGKENNHLRINVSKDNFKFQGVKWQEDNIEIPLDSKCDIAFYPRLNTFNDTTTVQFELVDIYSPCVNLKKQKKEGLKLFDHRKKTGILEEISKYLANDDLDILVWAKTPKTKEKIKNYENILKNAQKKEEKHRGIMFFDYPNSKEELKEILETCCAKKIHFMNCEIEKNIEEYIKNLNGMVKYCSNKLQGKLELDRMSLALGVNNNFIQIALEILEDLGSLNILDIDKIEYIKPFNYEDFKKSPMFEVLEDEFTKILEYKKALLTCDFKDLEAEIQSFSLA